MGTYTDLLQPKTETPKTPGTPVIVPNERNSARTVFRSEERSELRSENRTVATPTMTLPVRRQPRRYSFEFYDDQLAKLRQLKLQADMRGERIILSEMVRQALDRYLEAMKV